MKFLAKSFKAFDTFPVSFQPSLKPNKNQYTHKSLIGGIVSLVIYTLSLYYSVNLLLKWFNNQMVMKISNQPMNIDQSIFKNFNSQQSNATFQLVATGSNINPFFQDEIYILPLLINLTSQGISNILDFQQSETSDLSLNLKNITALTTGYYLALVQCRGNEQYLSNLQKCASQEKISQFLSQSGLEFRLEISMDKINVYTEEIENYQTFISLYVQKSIITEYTIAWEYSYYQIKKSQFITQTTTEYLLLTNYQFFNLFCEPGFLERNTKNYFNENIAPLENIIGGFFITSYANVSHIIAEYPSINEVLSSISSTFQTMMLVKFLFYYFNRQKMKKQFKDFCKDLYFPELKKITKTSDGTIYHEKNKLDPQQFSLFLKEIDRKLEHKMNYANLIYEISRMQIVLQELASKFQNQSSQLKRSKLILEQDHITKLYSIRNFSQQIDQNDAKLILDASFDPFIYSYQEQKESKYYIKKQVQMKSKTDIMFSKDNEEMQLENNNVRYSISMRVQQSFE